MLPAAGKFRSQIASDDRRIRLRSVRGDESLDRSGVGRSAYQYPSVLQSLANFEVADLGAFSFALFPCQSCLFQFFMQCDVLLGQFVIGRQMDHGARRLVGFTDLH